MNKVDLINEVFLLENEIGIVLPFSEDEDAFLGEISLDASPKEALHFKVEISRTYPLSDSEISVRFYLNPNIGVAHVNLDGSVCIHTPQHHDFEVRLKNEIKFLKKWRDKYYLKQDSNERYDYLNTQYSDASCFLFTDVAHQFHSGEFGEFKFSVFSDHSIHEKNITAHQAYILEIGRHKCNWADRVHRIQASGGFYVFIEDEPVKSPYRIVTDWVELEPYLPDDFLKILYNYKNRPLKLHKLMILIGYFIPGTNENKECHWQAISVVNNEIPVYGRKIGPKQYESSCYDYPINWNKTLNSGYERFFGRGCLSPKFTDKKILIIGVGAVGSGLATILVRSGVRHLGISDYDAIEPGNVCRSEYFLTESQLPKTIALAQHLQAISPFVDVHIKNRISKKDYGEFGSGTKAMLEEYDLVMDCSSDNEISYFIDRLQVSSEVVNISISNEAREMVLVTGRNITEAKKVIFDSLKETDPQLIYEGTGCWSPTFKASYFDIQSHLNLVVQNMNHQMETLGKMRTTVIKREIVGNNITLSTIDY
ncbi:MAG: ThiF family adenylyltransferase [Chloroflexia bacterium]|nr:ThiF family adenylyltransferase [Chloroflexia bacterium]